MIFYRILSVFAAARPTISLLFTTLSWGAAFFAKPGKLPKMTSQNKAERLPNGTQKQSKIN